jgi:hypothetical protein
LDGILILDLLDFVILYIYDNKCLLKMFFFVIMKNDNFIQGTKKYYYYLKKWVYFITCDVFKITFDENWMFEMFVDIKNSFCFIFSKPKIVLNLHNQI